ncbi:hypothetical protein [Streptomyces sp. Qhu_M48]|uniref:hypothetical protein n=1 Tax=Streptomyces sp. Qhu_M48 TaxID=3435889 RepID=UPI003F500CD7
MAATYHRHHLEHSGHSITVVYDQRRRVAETWVDGKTVAVTPTAHGRITFMQGEIPTDPAGPFVIRLRPPSSRDDALLCVLEMEGMRYLMPVAHPPGYGVEQADKPPPARTPGEILARWRHWIRRAARKRQTR